MTYQGGGRELPSQFNVTFMVLQLVYQLRRRLRTRGQQRRAQVETTTEDAIQRCVSRQQLRLMARRQQRMGTRLRKTRKTMAARQQRRCQASAPEEEVDWLLEQIDSLSQNRTGPGLRALADDDRLLVSQQQPVAALTAAQAGACLGAVLAALARVGQLDAGDDDGKFAANVEHLLLQLRGALTASLLRAAVALVVAGAGADAGARRLRAWFVEFGGRRRPLSTTWPWAIRPALAVLWGVCWKFIASPRSDSRSIWNLPPSPDPAAAQPRRRCAGPPDPIAASFRWSGLAAALPSYNPPDASSSPIASSSLPADPRLHPYIADASGIATDSDSAFAFAFAPAAAAAAASVPSLPRLPTLQHHHNHLHYLHHFPPSLKPGLHSPPSPQLGYGGSHHPPHQLTLPHLVVHHPSPAEPLAAAAATSTAPQLASLLDDHTWHRFSPEATHVYPVCYNYSNMSEQPVVVAEQPHHPTHTLTPSPTGMPLPVLSPESMSDGQPSPYPRPPSHISDRPGSEDESMSETRELISPKRAHSYKRIEEPPRNPQGKMVCKFQECNTLTFERKCEWSKHMDKHDRPYKCLARGCEKLQGFTYSGGLLRHEREVHKMHGGTKKSLFCPFSDCKRSSGSGFTRKENLQEHIRRVHRRTSGASDVGPRSAMLPDDREMDPEGHGQPAAQAVMAHQGVEMEGFFNDDIKMALGKRKRSQQLSPRPDGFVEEGEYDDIDLREEVKRLRKENEEQRDRLRQLEAHLAELTQPQPHPRA